MKMKDLYEKINLAKELNNIDVKFGDNLFWDFLEKRIDDSNILVLLTMGSKYSGFDQKIRNISSKKLKFQFAFLLYLDSVGFLLRHFSFQILKPQFDYFFLFNMITDDEDKQDNASLNNISITKS